MSSNRSTVSFGGLINITYTFGNLFINISDKKITAIYKNKQFSQTSLFNRIQSSLISERNYSAGNARIQLVETIFFGEKTFLHAELSAISEFAISIARLRPGQNRRVVARLLHLLFFASLSFSLSSLSHTCLVAINCRVSRRAYYGARSRP